MFRFLDRQGNIDSSEQNLILDTLIGEDAIRSIGND